MLFFENLEELSCCYDYQLLVFLLLSPDILGPRRPYRPSDRGTLDIWRKISKNRKLGI